MSGSPMDPERLAKLREVLADDDRVRCPSNDDDWLRELLDDRDHREAAYHQTVQEGRAEIHRVIRSTNIDVDDARAEAKRYRSRCPVTAEDCERAGVTYEKLDAWAAENSLAPARATDYQRHECRGLSDVGWACEGIFHGYSASWPGNRSWATTGGDIAGFITFACALLRCPAFDILDEMAALTPEAAR